MSKCKSVKWINEKFILSSNDKVDWAKKKKRFSKFESGRRINKIIPKSEQEKLNKQKLIQSPNDKDEKINK